jgi:hypothetical protein
MRQLPRFIVGMDPVAYDFGTTIALVKAYGATIWSAYERLKGLRFSFPTMDVLHKDAMDRELLFRQTLPASGVASTLGIQEALTEDYIVLYALGQTLILNHVDRHLDISASYTIRDPQLLLGDVHSTMCYAICCLYRMIRDMEQTVNGARALAAMADTSIEIIQSMHDNYARRFDWGVLGRGQELVSWYRDSDMSPHLGSGFYASSILGLLAYVGVGTPEHLPAVLVKMRRLRQRVDELADLFEDIASGLVSYPVAKALADPSMRDDVSRLIQRMWWRSGRLVRADRDVGRVNRVIANDRHLRSTYMELLSLMVSGGILDECYQESHDLWWEIALALSSDLIGARLSDILMAIADLKRALLERLKINDWHDRVPPHSFDDMLREAGVGEC